MNAQKLIAYFQTQLNEDRKTPLYVTEVFTLKNTDIHVVTLNNGDMYALQDDNNVIRIEKY